MASKNQAPGMKNLTNRKSRIKISIPKLEINGTQTAMSNNIYACADWGPR